MNGNQSGAQRVEVAVTRADVERQAGLFEMGAKQRLGIDDNGTCLAGPFDESTPWRVIDGPPAHECATVAVDNDHQPARDMGLHPLEKYTGNGIDHAHRLVRGLTLGCLAGRWLWFANGRY